MAMRRGQIAAALVALLLGACLVAYPYVSDFISRTHQIQAVGVQDDAVAKADKAAIEREMRTCREFNERLRNNRAVVSDPFDPSNQPVTSREYEQRLNLAGDGVMATLVIPKLDLTVPIYHGTGDDALQNGVGHMQTTSLPVGGASTHTVLAGHNGLPQVRIFDDIGKLRRGDYFVVQVLGEDHAYRVTWLETVLPDKTDSLVIAEGKDEATLVTCVPYSVNTHRLLVHAERCKVPQEWLDRDKNDSRKSASLQPGQAILPFSLAGGALVAGALLGRHLMRRRVERKVSAAASSSPYARPTRSRGRHFKGGGHA